MIHSRGQQRHAARDQLVEHKTIVEWAQVERAAVLGPELVVSLGEKFGFAGTPSEADKIRSKAVTLFLIAYDEVERAVSYLRWHEDDVRDVVPSVYQNQGSRSARATEGPEAAPAPATPVVATPTPAGSTPVAVAPAAGTTLPS